MLTDSYEKMPFGNGVSPDKEWAKGWYGDVGYRDELSAVRDECFFFPSGWWRLLKMGLSLSFGGGNDRLQLQGIKKYGDEERKAKQAVAVQVETLPGRRSESRRSEGQSRRPKWNGRRKGGKGREGRKRKL